MHVWRRGASSLEDYAQQRDHREEFGGGASVLAVFAEGANILRARFLHCPFCFSSSNFVKNAAQKLLLTTVVREVRSAVRIVSTAVPHSRCLASGCRARVVERFVWRSIAQHHNDK